jgi:hypothetical protein
VLDMKYDCLGSEVCWPANAVNALGIEGDACPAEPVKPQTGWPPLPGGYAVLRYHAPVAVCTLTDDALTTTIASWAGPYVQDAAPERPAQKNAEAKARVAAHGCGCGASCGDEQS